VWGHDRYVLVDDGADGKCGHFRYPTDIFHFLSDDGILRWWKFSNISIENPTKGIISVKTLA
ncbi:MAG: hypothetical protein QXT63_04360, partial [Thermoplasmata archaeon]